MKNLAFVSALLLLGTVGVAHAEDPNAPPPDQTGTPVMQPEGEQPVEQQPVEQQPVYQEQPVAEQPQQPVEVVEQEETAEEGRGIQYGAHLVVPIFLADNNDLLDPTVGIGVQGRVGWEFGAGFSAELQVGIMYNGSTSPDLGYSGYGVTNIWIGAGLRYSFLNESAIVPFVGAGIALDIWQNSQSYGGTTSSSGPSVVTFGANGNLGVQIEISPYIGIEAGAQINWNVDPGTDIAARPVLWLSPFVGGTLYF